MKWVIIQRSESLQSQLLDQICMFFQYFWSIEFNWFKVTIMSFKVCEIVSVQKLIQTKEDDDSWKIEQLKSSISLIAFVELNQRIFQWFLNHWVHLAWLYNCHHRKFFIREWHCNVWEKWSIDQEENNLASHHWSSDELISLSHEKEWLKE